MSSIVKPLKLSEVTSHRVYEVQVVRFRRLTLGTNSQHKMISFCFEESTSGNRAVVFRSSYSSRSSITRYMYLLVVQMGEKHYS